MNNLVNGLSKSHVEQRTVALEAAGFALAIITCWTTELLDPPFSLAQVLIETIVIAGLGSFTIYWTMAALKRIKYLEGFLVICAQCKRARIDDQWVPIEEIMSSQTDLTLSHGICPDCAEVLYRAHRL